MGKVGGARILILDGHSAAGLAVTRSAGKAGHWVAVGANNGLFAPAKLSRYCDASLSYPPATQEAHSFLDAVITFVRENSIDLVVPVTDWTLGPLSRERERFAGLCRVALPSQAALDAASDKYRTVQLAQAGGISTPHTLLVESVADLSQWPNRAFPVVVKDRRSIRWIGDRAVSGSVAYAYSTADLESLVRQRLNVAGDVLLQEFVSGTGIGYSCFVASGKVFLPFQWQRIREVDPRGSGSSARRSIALDSSIAAVSAQLILTMGFEGIAMVEFKKANDGRLVLMEVNGRPWGSIGLPIACGIDYPRYWIEWCLHGTLPPEAIAYRENLLCRRALGELTHLTALRRGAPANWPLPYPNFWKTLITMAVPWRPGMCYDDLWLSDLRPGLAGIGNWLQSRVKGKS